MLIAPNTMNKGKNVLSVEPEKFLEVAIFMSQDEIKNYSRRHLYFNWVNNILSSLRARHFKKENRVSISLFYLINSCFLPPHDLLKRKYLIYVS